MKSCKMKFIYGEIMQKKDNKYDTEGIISTPHIPLPI